MVFFSGISASSSAVCPGACSIVGGTSVFTTGVPGCTIGSTPPTPAPVGSAIAPAIGVSSPAVTVGCVVVVVPLGTPVGAAVPRSGITSGGVAASTYASFSVRFNASNTFFARFISSFSRGVRFTSVNPSALSASTNFGFRSGIFASIRGNNTCRRLSCVVFCFFVSIRPSSSATSDSNFNRVTSSFCACVVASALVFVACSAASSSAICDSSTDNSSDSTASLICAVSSSSIMSRV